MTDRHARGEGEAGAHTAPQVGVHLLTLVDATVVGDYFGREVGFLGVGCGAADSEDQMPGHGHGGGATMTEVLRIV